MEKSKIIDLHTHTTYSDGEYSPKELIDMAISKDIGTLAITDHNTTKGLHSFNREDYQNDIKIIDGIELSAECNPGRMHILGLDIDPNNEDLNKAMKLQESYSINKLVTIIEQIKRDYGISFQKEDFVNLVNASHSVGRPDLATLCIKYGYAKNIDEAFDNFLNPAYNKTKELNKRLSYEECIHLIKQSGGIPILAHPISLGMEDDKFRKLIQDMKSCGLEGIEAYHSNHSYELMKYYEQVAKDSNLYISAGSDYHGPFKKPGVELGSGKDNNLNIRKLSLVKKFK